MVLGHLNSWFWIQPLSINYPLNIESILTNTQLYPESRIMWLLLAFLSAALLGFYDVFKKQSLKNNAVIPVLFLNVLFSSLIFFPFILVSALRPEVLKDTNFFVPVVDWHNL